VLRRAQPRRGQAGRPLPVRAAGLFRGRSRQRGALRVRQAGLQPHGLATGYVGEDREGGEVRRAVGSPMEVDSHATDVIIGTFRVRQVGSYEGSADDRHLRASRLG